MADVYGAGDLLVVLLDEFGEQADSGWGVGGEGAEEGGEDAEEVGGGLVVVLFPEKEKLLAGGGGGVGFFVGTNKNLFHKDAEDCFQPCRFDELLAACGSRRSPERVV